jgi:glyoxylase-like metal-dependent hydrolase (beta-lactamase superfamily II)
MHREIMLGIGLVFVLSAPVFSDPQPDRAAMIQALANHPIEVKPLRGGVFWVSGGVSNTGFILGDKGVIVIDAQMFVPVAQKVLAEIARITPHAVNEIILTHSDPDHINGLPAYPLGIEIIAQTNTRTEMLAALADPHPLFTTTPPAVKNYLPTRVVQAQASLTLDGVRVVLLHTAPAHTDGDLIVYLPAQKIVFAGDLLAPSVGPFPGIHLEKHGSSLGWIASTKAMLALDADIFISGHGAPLNRTELQARIQSAEQRREQIALLVNQHKTLEEVKAALREEPPTGEAALFPTFTETTYQELTQP